MWLGRLGQIDVPILLQALALTQPLTPSLHILHKRIQIALVAEINRLLVLTNLSDLRTNRNVGQAEVNVIDFEVDGAGDLAIKDILWQAGFLADWASDSDTADGVEGLGHGADGLENSDDVCLGFGEGLDDLLCELDEERFTLLGGFSLVAKSQRLVGSTRNLDIIESGLLQSLAELLCLLRRESLVLELDGVDLDTNYKAAWKHACEPLQRPLE